MDMDDGHARIGGPQADGIFLSTEHRQRFGQVESVLASGRGCVLLTSEWPMLAEHYGLMLREQLRARPGVVVENYLPGSSTALLSRFNSLVSSMSVAEARGLQAGGSGPVPARVFLIHDPETMTPDEGELLARLLSDFPGARVCLLMIDSGLGGVTPSLRELFRRQLDVWSIAVPAPDAIGAFRQAAVDAGEVAGFDVLLERAGITGAGPQAMEAGGSPIPGRAGERRIAKVVAGAASVEEATPGEIVRVSVMSAGELAAEMLEEAEASALSGSEASRRNRLMVMLTFLLLGLGVLGLWQRWFDDLPFSERQPASVVEPLIGERPFSRLSAFVPGVEAAAGGAEIFALPEPNDPHDDDVPSQQVLKSSELSDSAVAGDSLADSVNKSERVAETATARNAATVMGVVEPALGSISAASLDLEARLRQGRQAVVSAAEASWFVQNHRFSEAENALGWLLAVEAQHLSAAVAQLVLAQGDTRPEEWLAVFGPFVDFEAAERFVQESAATADYWIRSRQSLLGVMRSLED